ncbi:MAG: hypothetical protein KDI45_01300 [Candidatus Accumulibacter sp.]|nr:hypothetical protein [Accumulibacter sp.]MCB1965326.1 hypothetical protein [Accumulibacter sp.]
MERLTREQLQFVLQSAILAPSADNHHRIHFQLRDDRLLVCHRETGLPPEGSYKRVLALLSLGALVENLSIAASRFGATTKIALLPDAQRADLLLEITLQCNGVEADSLWPQIPMRHTNRQLMFRGPGMSELQQSEMATAVRACPVTQLLWLDDPERRRQALALMRRAETERFRNRLLHEELFSAIRFDVGWHVACPEGLPPGALGVEAPLRPFFALLRHWRLARLANLLGTHHMLGVRSCYLPCRLAPHLGLLAVSQPDSQSALDAGRAFERLWLLATAHGRVLQPMPASALYALPGALAEGIPDALQHALAGGWKSILGEAVPLMLFRMGSAPQSAIVTGRPLLDSWLEG